jgi:hypothetical protein
MKVVNFISDGAAVAGIGAELLTGQNQIPVSSLGERGIRILKLKQPAGAVLANDADWMLRRNRGLTGDAWLAESLDPANGGGMDLGPRGITIGPLGTFGMDWFGQGAAQANQLQVFYESL